LALSPRRRRKLADRVQARERARQTRKQDGKSPSPQHRQGSFFDGGRSCQGTGVRFNLASASLLLFAVRFSRRTGISSLPRYAATIATRLGGDGLPGSVARPAWSAIERGPTGGREPPSEQCNSTIAIHARRKVLCEVGSTASGWDSSRRCLNCHPRGASMARHDRYEVISPSSRHGTPSACAEALSTPISLSPTVAARIRCRLARLRAG
jgi:hypothetical protein